MSYTVITPANDPCVFCMSRGNSFGASTGAHAHCANCESAILPGMDACAWCGDDVPAITAQLVANGNIVVPEVIL